MSDYTGRCEAKGWRWKPVKLSDFDLITDEDQIGVACCVVETSSGVAFGDACALGFEGDVVEQSPHRVELRTHASPKKDVNIDRFNALRVFVESNFKQADRALLAVKKSPSQVNIQKCGAK